MLNRSFKLLILFICMLPNWSIVNADQPRAADQPNILWLSCEDIGPHLGCYGYETVKTPSIDALAARSLTYDFAWSNYPVCAPARTTIITGMYATSLGAGNMRCNAIRPASVKLLPALMRRAGYYCTNASKTDYNFSNPGKPWDDSSRNAHWKNRPDNKPFFAVFNSTVTHESRIRKRPHRQQIDPADVSLFPYWPDTKEVRTDWAQYLDNIQKMDDWVAKRLAEIQDAGLADDTIVVFFGDHGSGMPRHKRFAGDSGMRVPMIVHVSEKWKSFWSKQYRPGGRSAVPMSFIDLAPSTLHVAGAEIPKRMQGNSIFGADSVREKYVYGFRNRMDERNDLSRSICDGRYVYIRNYMPNLPAGQFVDYQQQTPTSAVWKQLFDQGKLTDVQSAFWQARSFEEMYDLKNDPHETKNIAQQPEFATRKAELAIALNEKIKTIQDLDFVPEAELFQFEQDSGSSRIQYLQRDGFSLDRLIDVAGDRTLSEEDLLDDQAAIRFWALQKLLSRPSKERISLMVQVRKLFNDPSAAVRAKAAEVALSCEQKISESIDLLVGLANCRNSNYYAAVNALSCLDRYRSQLSEETFERIRELPLKSPLVKRGEKNIIKMMNRFK